jgi:hypothetical protein
MVTDRRRIALCILLVSPALKCHFPQTVFDGNVMAAYIIYIRFTKHIFAVLRLSTDCGYKIEQGH